MNQKLRNLVYTAMLMALCCVATLVIKIPTVTGGYLNAGDIVVVLAALLAGPLYGGVATPPARSSSKGAPPWSQR